MGLDMYAFKCNKKYVLSPLEVDKKSMENDNYKMEPVFNWWKNRHLHNWMQDLYYSKGGKNEFNCDIVELSLDDINSLECDIESGRIAELAEPGFFFGDADYNDNMKEKDLEFVTKARELIHEGMAIFYYSWW